MKRASVIVLIALSVALVGCGKPAYEEYFNAGATDLQQVKFILAMEKVERFTIIDIKYADVDDNYKLVIEERVIFNYFEPPSGITTWFRDNGNLKYAVSEHIIWVKIYK